jgi:ABC-2 type transport system permease protein
MGAILAIARNDLRILARDRMGLFWALAFPVVMAVFMGVAFGGGGPVRSLPVVLVNESSSALAQALTRELQGNTSLWLQTHTAPDDQGTTRPYTLEEARDRVRRGQVVAYVRLTDQLRDVTSLFQTTAPVELGTDPSRGAEAGFLQGILVQSLLSTAATSVMETTITLRDFARRGQQDVDQSQDLTFLEKQAFHAMFASVDQLLQTVDGKVLGVTGSSDKGTSVGAPGSSPPTIGMDSFLRTTAVEPKNQQRPKSGFEVTFPSGILWGVVGVVATFAMALVLERQEGTLLRLRVAPLNRTTIMAGKALGCFLACLGSVGLVLAVGVFGFGIRILSYPGLMAAVMSIAGCFTGVMMFLATLGKTEKAVAGGGWAVLLVMMMFGGGMIPLIGMPEWMQSVSHLSPARWAIVALEGAVWREFSPSEMMGPCLVLWGVGGVGFLAGMARFRED